MVRDRNLYIFKNYRYELEFLTLNEKWAEIKMDFGER